MRVIAGRLGSRKLRVPPRGVRPTTDRVRESLFGALGDLSGVRGLDLFAGSGALGIEALSRGASEVVFVERARTSLATLRANLADLGLAEVSEVIACEALRALGDLAQRGAIFDVVWLDPPYEADDLPRVLADLLRLGLVSPDGVVVVERSKRNPLEQAEGWRLERERTYGDTVLSQLRPDPALPVPGSQQEAMPDSNGD